MKNTFYQDKKCFLRCDSILLFPSLDVHLGKMEKKIHNFENGDKNKNVLIVQQMEYFFLFHPDGYKHILRFCKYTVSPPGCFSEQRMLISVNSNVKTINERHKLQLVACMISLLIILFIGFFFSMWTTLSSAANSELHVDFMSWDVICL